MCCIFFVLEYFQSPREHSESLRRAGSARACTICQGAKGEISEMHLKLCRVAKLG